MNQFSTRTTAQTQAIKEFHATRIRALLNSWLAKLTLQTNGLRTLVGSNVTGLHAKQLTRTQRIRIDQVVGTIRYTEEFDKDFRPLSKQAQDRWVETFLRLDEDRWQPIVVHRVGTSYYVASGHYQVSVARCTGMKFIEAKVWDHSSCQTSDDTCASNQRMPNRHKESFSTN